MAEYKARIIRFGLRNEVKAAIERDLAATELAMAKIEALRAAQELPEANRIVLSESGSEVAVCRLESMVAEWS
jgi:hypothetical protein